MVLYILVYKAKEINSAEFSQGSFPCQVTLISLPQYKFSVLSAGQFFWFQLGEFGFKSNDILWLVVFFFSSHHISSRKSVDIGTTNSLLVISGSSRVRKNGIHEQRSLWSWQFLDKYKLSGISGKKSDLSFRPLPAKENLLLYPSNTMSVGRFFKLKFHMSLMFWKYEFSFLLFPPEEEKCFEE